MDHPAQARILQNGSGWYWEVVIDGRDVIARGIADTHAQACADAEKETSQTQAPAQCWAARTVSINQDLAI
jgi:hypothetical protein